MQGSINVEFSVSSTAILLAWCFYSYLSNIKFPKGTKPVYIADTIDVHNLNGDVHYIFNVIKGHSLSLTKNICELMEESQKQINNIPPPRKEIAELM
jgi:hypothetical protein